MKQGPSPRPPKSVVHHYIPEFLLRGWVGEDGRLERFTRPHGANVHVRRVYPSQVGFERRLYDFAPYDEAKFSGLEHEFFQHIDNLAAKAKEKLLFDLNGEWSSELRSAWSRFLLSLVHRTPESIATYRQKLRNILNTFSPDTQQRWEEIRGAADPDLYLDYLALDPNYFDLTALRLLPQLIDNGNVGLFMNRMTWGVMRFTGCDRSLLISDYPLVISNGIDKPDGHIALALGPRELFVACHRRELFNFLTAQANRETVFNYNKCVVQRARRFVAACDRRHARFIDNRFGSKPIDLFEQVLDRVQAEGLDRLMKAHL